MDRKSFTNNHSKLVDDILFAIGSLPNVRLFKRHVGFDAIKKVKYGVQGESDLQGIISPGGRALAIEIKTGSGVLSKEQVLWKNMWIKMGGVYVEARSVQQALDDLKSQL